VYITNIKRSTQFVDIPLFLEIDTIIGSRLPKSLPSANRRVAKLFRNNQGLVE